MKSLSLLISLLPLASSHVGRRDGKCPYHEINPNRLVPNRYRVLFHDNHTLEDHLSYTGLNLQDPTYGFSWGSSINGYHATLTESTLHDLVRLDPGVEIVEHTTFSPPFEEPLDGQGPFQREPGGNLHKRWTETVGIRPWYLRMTNSGKKEELDPTSDVKDSWWTEAGTGVKIYVMDSGMRITHNVFGGRASNFGDGLPFSGDPDWNDVSGHGTHVGGIAAMQAPAAKIINVKVMANNHTVEMTIAGLDAIVQQHLKDVNDPNYNGAVINMSLGEDDSEGLRRAVGSAIHNGIAVVTSAGNTQANVTTIPCGYDKVICVAACTSSYEQWSASNYGPYVTLLAPGVSMLSAFKDDDNQWFSWSGTSMASPMVAGIVAGYIGYERLRNDIDTVHDRLAANSIFDVLSKISTRSGTPNILAQTGYNAIGKLPTMPYFIHFSVARDTEQPDEAAKADLEEGPQATVTQTDTPEKVILVPTGIVTRGLEPPVGQELPADQATPLTLTPRPLTSSTTTTSEAPAPTERLECGIPKKPMVFFNKFNINAGQDAIDKICDWKNVNVDMHRTGYEYQGIDMLYGADGRYALSGTTPNGDDICAPWPGTCDMSGSGSGFILGFYADYDDGGLEGVNCPPHQGYDFPSGEECKTIFMSIMNGCNTDTTTEKGGGYMYRVTSSGCMRYTMGARPW